MILGIRPAGINLAAALLIISLNAFFGFVDIFIQGQVGKLFFCKFVEIGPVSFSEIDESSMWSFELCDVGRQGDVDGRVIQVQSVVDFPGGGGEEVGRG